MLRVLLVCAGLTAIAVVLWSSWRVDRRLFAFVLSVVLVGALLFGVGYWRTADQAMVVIMPEQVRLSVEQARGMETGIRLSGRVYNQSAWPVALIKGRAVLEECTAPGQEACREIGGAAFRVRQHVPVGGSYPYSQVVRLSDTLLADPAAPDSSRRWRIDVLSVSGYAAGAQAGQ